MSLGPFEAAPHLFKYAILYRKVAEHSGGAIGPDVVDTWDSWQCASFLGIGLPVPDAAAPGATGGTRDVVAENIEWHKARARGENPPAPEPDLPSGDVVAALGMFDLRGGGTGA